MAPSRRKGSVRAAAAAAARQQWKVGDLVLAKMKGFPAWPAMVSEPEEWGYSSDRKKLPSDRKKLLVYFYGTKQIAFCNYADVEAFTEEKKKLLLTKRQGKGADFVRAVNEIVDVYENLKRQNHDKFNSGDEGTVSSAGNSEGSKSKSFNRSPELNSHITDIHQSEALCTSIESRDMFNPEEIPATSTGVDLHNASTEKNGLTGTISMLDQLRQTPLVIAANSRKRLRDAPLQSFTLQRRVTSLRKSRTAGGNLSKLQKSTMIINSTNPAGDDLISDSAQEESTLKEKSIGKVPHISVSCDAVMPASASLPSNGTSEDILSETASLKSEVINLNDGSLLDSSCKIEHPGKGHSEDARSNVRLNEELGLPMKTLILKKKRKPNRKRVTSSTECTKLNKEADSQVQLDGRLSESPNSRCETNEISYSVEGDEHLPLVKRARARMSKPLEEAQLDEIIDTKERSNATVMIDKSHKCITSASSGNSCPAYRTTLSVKEALSPPVANDYTPTSGRDLMFWNTKKYHLKSIALDVEAALPPSKRLHRALEAMSANAAESADDCTETPSAMELISNGCMDSPKTSPVCLSTDRIVECPSKSESMQPSVSNAFPASAAILPSCLTSQNLEVSTITLPELKPDESLAGNYSSSCNKNCSEILMDVKDCNGSSISEMADKDVPDNNLKHCSLNMIEKQQNATSSEGMSDKLPASEGVSGQLASPLGELNLNRKLQPTKKRLYSRVDNFCGDGMLIQKPISVSNFTEREDFVPQNGAAPILSTIIASSTSSNTFGMLKSSNSEPHENTRARDMQDVAKEVKENLTPKEWGISPDLTPMKDLIAAAQAKRLMTRSTSFSDNAIDGKTGNTIVSPTILYKDETSGQGLSPNSTGYNTHASDDSIHHLQNGSRSPHAGLRQKGSDKFPCHVEANTARKTFEALLCTLSRTKESIGRATRFAIDCAKYGIAGEVVEILLQTLERESSLYRRVDLFFLVDSITQCSRQKGGAGDVYPALVQSVLPRLLCAAAPPGNAACENRRQCLKVLRVWLERKTLPESIVRHHMRELESANEASFTSAYSRRPSRTERALNDPIREMEGMLVDEYGSNTSFQLPSFLHSRVFEEEESSDDEKSFEAVTPESNVEVDDNRGTTQLSAEKHRHVLEDVDGELEMEDLAPPCEVEGNINYQVDRLHLVSFAPPLPEDNPPSPPPLPSSPPPLPSSPPPNASCSPPMSLIPQNQSVGSHALSDAAEFHLSSVTNNLQNLPPQSMCQQPSNLDANLISSVSVPYCATGYAGPQQQLARPVPSLSSSSSYSNLPVSHPAMQTGNKNNVQPLGSVSLPNKAYHLQPPPPTVSNQFSYVHAEPRQTQQSWGNCSSLPDRFHYVSGNQRESFYGDRGARVPIQHEIPERGRFSPAVHLGPVLPDKVEATMTSVSLYGPPSESSTIPCRGWSLPSRTSNYSVPPRPSLENPISRVAGAPGYWRPR